MSYKPHYVFFIFLILVFSCPLFPQIPEFIPIEAQSSTYSVNFDADDPAIWINPNDPSLSLIIGTDKGTFPNGGLFVWNIDGSLQQRINISHPNNVDVISSYEDSLDIVVFTMRDHDEIRVYKVDPDSRTLLNITTSGGIHTYRSPYGLTLYKRKSDNTIYAIISSTSKEYKNKLWQIRLEDDGDKKVKGVLVREFGVHTDVIEGMVADDELGYLYAAEEEFGIHKYYADPDMGDERLALFATNDSITGNREGLALYPCSDGTGYLLVACPSDNAIMVYRREGDDGNVHDHRLVTTLQNSLAEGGDGIDITNFNLSQEYPHGILVWHNKTHRRFDIFAWDKIANNDLKICTENLISHITVPIELVHFKATLRLNFVHLQWETIDEKDNFGFEIERRLSDRQFKKIAFIKGKGNSQFSSNYEYFDKDVSSGEYYYRLKQIDTDGLYAYSKEVKTVIDKSNKIKLEQNYPNPLSKIGVDQLGSAAQTKISFQLPEKTRVNLSIYNVLGEKIKTLCNDFFCPGFYNLIWDGKNSSDITVPNGLYLISMQTNESYQVQKMTVVQ